jgi:hypothetical protein
MPVAVFFGIILTAIVFGMWRANRGVRLVSILFIITGGFVMFSGTGIEMGIPGAFQAIGAALLAAGLAGMFLSLIHR